MRFLMELCEKSGAEVSGSDERLGGHDESNVIDVDLVVYSLAISPDNPELKEARARGIPVLSRAQFLGEIAKNYDTVIAVAGTHGKTTTTAMLWEIFEFAHPTVHIGGRYKGKNGQVGESKIFITEACEYRRAFLSLAPDIAIVLNVDHDHVDCYPTPLDAQKAFLEFEQNAGVTLKNLQFDLQKNQGAYREICDTNRVIDHADCNYCAKNIRHENGWYSFDFCVSEHAVGRIELSVRGIHNAQNALYAAATAYHYGVDFQRIKSGLKSFVGVSGRLEFLGLKNGKAIYTDYAHHPSEIAACNAALKECGYKRIMAVFEPHTYSRTKAFFASLSQALGGFDSVAILPVFAARERGDDELAKSLSQAVYKITRGFFVSDSETLFEKIKNEDCDAVVFMGAGKSDALAKSFFSDK